ncbi:MAG: RimK/LysX family protein [Pirellulales bacterium]
MTTIGWREWLSLPELHIDAVKAKVDSGARSSALHAFDIELFRRGTKPMVRFKVHPLQRDTQLTVTSEAELVGHRLVRNSGGYETLRPVILTAVELLGQRWPIELTLTGRDAMGFRMLLGRQAVRRRFLIDTCRSYLGGKRADQAAGRRSNRPKRNRP